MRRQLTGTESGLVAYYAFDDGTGTVAHDSTGKGNDATLAPGAGALPTWISSGPVCVHQEQPISNIH
jgi:hypothetical protein